MKKWSLRIYLVIVHPLLAASLGYIGWHKNTIASLPMRVEWHWGSTYKDAPMAMAFPDIEDSDYGIARIGDEKIALFSFKKGVFDSMTMRWPGDPKEFTLKDGRISMSGGGSVLGNEYHEFYSTFIDHDGDGAFDMERRSTETDTSGWWASWTLLHRRPRLPDGTQGTLDIFHPDGSLAIRVTEQISRPDGVDSNLSIWPTATYLVERFIEGELDSTETLTEAEYARTAFYKEVHGEWPPAGLAPTRTTAPAIDD